MKGQSVDCLIQAIHADIGCGKLILPTLPDVASNIRSAVCSGQASADEVAEIVSSDMATASRLVQVANCSLFAASACVNSVKAAVHRLGNNKTCQLVTSFVLQQLFHGEADYQSRYLKSIWQHSVNVAAMSRAFALFAPHLDADEAMLAGLVHQIGKLPVLRFFSQQADLGMDAALFDAVIEQGHPAFGELLLKAWRFPEELIAVPKHYSHLQRQHANAADYVDLVQVAFLQAMAGSEHAQADHDWSRVPAFAKLGLLPSQPLLDEQQLTEQIEWAHSILHG